MKKFNLKEHIAKNKATFFSSLNEGNLGHNEIWSLEKEGPYHILTYTTIDGKKEKVFKSEEEAKTWIENNLNEGYDEFKRAEKGSKDVTAKDKGEEEVYGAGVKKGEEIEKKKMKKSELKAKIKEMIVAEMDGAAVVDSEYDFLKEIDEIDINDPALMKARAAAHQRTLPKSPTPKPTTAEKNAGKINLLKRLKAQYLQFMEMEPEGGPMTDLYNLGTEAIEKIDKSIAKLSGEKNVAESKYDFLKEIEEMLDEADEETDVDVEAADDTTGEDTTAGEEIDVTTNEVDPNVKAVQDALTQAQAAAQQLGDKKLMDQIGNTITFFTRAHVVNKPKGAVAEGEEYDDFNDKINVSDMLNETNLWDGDIITPDMWADDIDDYEGYVNYISGGKLKSFKDKNWTLKYLGDIYFELKSSRVTSTVLDIVNVQKLLKPHYKLNPPLTESDDYEDDDYEDDDYDLDAEFANSPNQASFEDVFNVIQSYEDDEILDDFTSKFPSMKPVNKEKYRNFAMNYIDDMSEMDYIKANWISMFDEDVYEKAGLAENKNQ
jgi:hypothetical protein